MESVTNLFSKTIAEATSQTVGKTQGSVLSFDEIKFNLAQTFFNALSKRQKASLFEKYMRPDSVAASSHAAREL